jgi:hypothetical protein
MSTNYNKQTLGSGFASTSQLQDSEDETETSFNDTLSRTASGTEGNTMEVDLDMNSNDLLNVASINAQSIVVSGVELGGGGSTDVGAVYNWTDQHNYTLPPTVNTYNVITTDTADTVVVKLNTQTGLLYTTVLTDRSALVTLDNAAAIGVTIPPNVDVAYPVGTALSFAQLGAGQVTIVAGAAVTLESEIGLKIAAQFGFATLIKIASPDTWLVSGSMSA